MNKTSEEDWAVLLFDCRMCGEAVVLYGDEATAKFLYDMDHPDGPS